MYPLCLVFVAIISLSTSFKYLVYSPFLGYSHVNLLGSLADVLTEGGHDVTILMPEIDEEQLNHTGTELTKKIIRVPGDPRTVQMIKKWSKNSKVFNMWTLSASPSIIYEVYEMTKNITDMLKYQCESLINNEQLLQSLREEKFDVGIAEAYYVYGLALFELLDIKTTIAMLSNVHLESAMYAIGEPAFPSYVPGLMSTAGDKMTFSQRLQNALALIFGRMASSWVNENEIDVIKQKYGSFKDHYELIAQTSFIFTRANPYLDFPRPTLHKTVMIGGFATSRKLRKKHLLTELKLAKGYPSVSAMSTRALANLPNIKLNDAENKSEYQSRNQNMLCTASSSIVALLSIAKISKMGGKIINDTFFEFSSFLGRHNHTVLISFGTVVKSRDMPESYKKSILAVISSMPEVGFIWKYEDPELDSAKTLSNVLLSPWVPQIALLKNKRLSVFVTHGGIGSCNELAYTGKAAIIIPIVGDQMRNAQMMARHGGALVLETADLNDADKLRRALVTIINDPRYAENAFRLSQMLRNQPIAPEELLLRHAEFAAKFGRIPNLDSYGRHLSTVQYFLLDIAAAAVVVVVLISTAFLILLRKCLFSRRQKAKSD